MNTYILEYTNDFGMTKVFEYKSRLKAMSSARYRSEQLNTIVYVLDANRTGHVAFANGVIDHKEGASI